MFVIVRAVIYATLFIGFFILYLPYRLLLWADVVRADGIEVRHVAGIAVGAIGACLALWCIFTFASAGKGTPAPFDPPRRLVIRGPYRFVRNPMYMGAVLALTGSGIFFRSQLLFGYTGLFWLTTHLLVVLYEEPALRQTFGKVYEDYCASTSRWIPAMKGQKKIRS